MSQVESLLRNASLIQARGLERGELVVVAPHNGLGNRVQTVVSSYALALATGRALVVDWPRCQQLQRGTEWCEDPASIEDLYLPPPFASKWPAVRTVMRGPEEEKDINRKAWGVALLDKPHYVPTNSEIGPAMEWRAKTTDWRTVNGSIFVHTDHDFLDELVQNPSLPFQGMSADDLYSILDRFLLRPTDAVVERLCPPLLKVAKCTLGVHLRKYAIGHVTWPRNGSIFVANDNRDKSKKSRHDLFEKALERNLSALWISGVETRRISIQATVDALAENYILSTCATRVSSRRNSTFFRLADVRGDQTTFALLRHRCHGLQHRRLVTMDPSPQRTPLGLCAALLLLSLVVLRTTKKQLP